MREGMQGMNGHQALSADGRRKLPDGNRARQRRRSIAARTMTRADRFARDAEDDDQ